ncbi:MAG: hypothetical protein KBS62_04425 [Oscillospiraceae bacterium]|nr:hypothetical protein [Candidatus Ruminococcus equi]
MGINDEFSPVAPDGEIKEKIEVEETKENENDAVVPETAEDIIDGINTVQSITGEEIPEISDEEIEEITDEDISDVVLDIKSELTFEESNIEPQKKPALQIPIIIAICIVVGALLGFGIYYGFFAHTVNGIWEYKASDENTYYYTFKDENIVSMTMGTIDFNGEYSVTSADGSQTLMIGQYYGELSGEYTMTISGSRLFGNQVMTLKTADGTETTLKQSSTPKSPLTVSPDFKADEKLVGDWEYVFEDYGISYKFSFTADGKMQINQYDMIVYNCVYTTDGSNIKCTFFTTEETTEDIEYSFEGDSLIIMGIKCERVGASTPSQK